MKLSAWLLKNPWLAGIVAAGLGFVPLIGWLGSVMIAFITLEQGWKNGLIITVFALVPELIQGVQGQLMAYASVGFSGIYVYLVSLGLYKNRSWSWALNFTAIISIILVALIRLSAKDVSHWWYQHFLLGINDLRTSILALTHLLSSWGQSELASQYWLEWQQVQDFILQSGALKIIAQGMTGLLVSGAFLVNLINVILGSSWRQHYRHRGALTLSRELEQVRLHPVLTGLYLSSAGLAWLWEPALWDIAFAMTLMMLLSSIALCHFHATKLPYSWAWLIGFYSILFIYPEAWVIFMICVGVLDSFLNIRVRCSEFFITK